MSTTGQRPYRKYLGEITYVYAARARGSFPRVHIAHAREAADGTVTPSAHTLCGVQAGDAAAQPFMGARECRRCERLHPIWGDSAGGGR